MSKAILFGRKINLTPSKLNFDLYDDLVFHDAMINQLTYIAKNIFYFTFQK